jgi:hypothetical protein
MNWICVSKCFKYGHLGQPGDVLEMETDVSPGEHFIKDIDGVFPATGRRIGVADGRAYLIDNE